MRLGLITTLVAGALVVVTGDIDGKIMTEQQPMKMAAAEALYETAQPAPFSVFTVGTLDGSEPVFSVEVPRLLSFLATGDWNGKVHGINDLQAEYSKTFADSGLTDFRPNIPVSYWSFRLMMGAGMVACAYAIWALWVYRRGRNPRAKWHGRLAAVIPLVPLLGISFGWIFTEMGRQPWIVFGVMPTFQGVSPVVSSAQVWTSLISFTLIYAILAAVEVGLILSTVKQGPPERVSDPFQDREIDAPLTVSY